LPRQDGPDVADPRHGVLRCKHPEAYTE